MSETLTRPNGKPYRRRAPLRVETFEDPYESTGVAVFGTHSLMLANALAAHVIEDYELDPSIPQLGWWRLVPWDDLGLGCDHTWIVDYERGQPVVWWEAS